MAEVDLVQVVLNVPDATRVFYSFQRGTPP